MKKPKAPRLVTIAISTTITITFWIFFSLYTIFTSKPPPEVDPKLLESIDPTFDALTMSKLEGRISIEESEVGNFSRPAPTTPTPIPPENEITTSPETEVQPEIATESSTINQ